MDRSEHFHEEPGKIESRRVRSNHSSRNASNVVSAAWDFATITTIQPGTAASRCRRQISRRRRRTRFRTTAPPTRREVMIPKREASPSGPFTALRRRYLPWATRPSLRASANSRPRRTRAARGKRSFLRLGVAGEMDFDTLRQQALAATLTATSENGASALGFHPRAETKLLLACALTGLIGAFHKKGSKRIGEFLRKTRNVKAFETQHMGVLFAAAPSTGRQTCQKTLRTSPPSTRSAAPLIAEESGLLR